MSSASTSKRGYGWKHQKLRNRWAREVARGEVDCARCGEPIWPEEPWDLGHVDGDKTRYSGPEHRACNRATATHNAKRRRESRSSSWEMTSSSSWASRAEKLRGTGDRDSAGRG
jgi:hypothetical protein